MTTRKWIRVYFSVGD